MKTVYLYFLLILFSCSSIQRDEIKIEYYPNKMVKSEVPLVNGKENGLKKVYFENGVLQETCCMKDDIPVGTINYFDKNGQLRKIETRNDNGIADGLYIEFFPNGKINFYSNISKGKKEGKMYGFYENGQLRYETCFKNDKFEGIQYQFYPMKNIFWEYFCKNGKTEGELKYYDKNGEIAKICTYKNDSIINQIIYKEINIKEILYIGNDSTLIK